MNCDVRESDSKRCSCSLVGVPLGGEDSTRIMDRLVDAKGINQYLYSN